MKETEGWIDLRVSGYADVDFNAPGLTVEAVKAVTERLAADGTVGYLPTLVTGDPDVLIGVDRIVMEARRKYPICEKNILGVFPDGHHLPDTMLQPYVRAVPLKRLVTVSDAQYPAGLSSGEYEVCGAHARLEPSGLLWNPARNCLVGATTPIARCMEILRERIGLTPAECRAIGHDNALELIG